MKTSPLRFVLALVLGVFVAYCVFIFLLSYTPRIFSYADLDEGYSQDAYINYMKNLPVRGTLAIIGSCILGAFAGGYTAARIEKNRKKDASLGVGISLTVMLVFLSITYSFPLFLAIGIITVQLPFTWFGGRVGAKR